MIRRRASLPLIKIDFAVAHTQWPLLLIISLGTLLRLYTIATKPIWLDEAFSIWLANQPLVDLWAWLIKIDQHPPLYYTLLHGWQLAFGDLQGAVRLFSALCSALTLPFFYGAGRRFLDDRTALIATLLLAIAPFHIHYAQEARMYALLTLTVAIALYLLARLLVDRPAHQPQWLWPAFGIAQAAVMLTHNTAAVFFPVALNLAIGGALLWLHRYGGISTLGALQQADFERQWLRAQGVALICWLPWSIPFLIQAVGVDREFWIAAPTWTMIRETLHTFHLAFQPSVPVSWQTIDLSFGLLLLLGIWQLWAKGARLGLLLSLALTPIALALLVSLRRPIFDDRILLWVTLPYYLLLAAGIRQLYTWLCRLFPQRTWYPTRTIANLLTGALLLAIGALNGQALHNYYTNFAKEEWDLAAAHVAAHAELGDLILFNATWVQLPFVYYLRHDAIYPEIANNLHGLPVDLFDRGQLEPKMTPSDLPHLQHLLTDHDRVWLIYSHDWYTDPQGLIPRELRQRLRLVEQQQFIGLQVMRFE